MGELAACSGRRRRSEPPEEPEHRGGRGDLNLAGAFFTSSVVSAFFQSWLSQKLKLHVPQRPGGHSAAIFSVHPLSCNRCSGSH